MFKVDVSSQERLVVNKSLFLVRKTDFSRMEDELGIIKKSSSLPEHHVQAIAIYQPLTITGLTLSSIATVAIAIYIIFRIIKCCKAASTASNSRKKNEDLPRDEDFEA